MDAKEWIKYLKNGEDTKAISLLYQYFPVVKSYIVDNSGTEADARDVFQESLMILYKKNLQPQFEFSAKVETFLYGIAKNLWWDELRKRNKAAIIEKDEYLSYQEDIQVHKEVEKKYELLDLVLTKLGKNCLQILQLFYYKKMAMSDIAKQLDYKNVNTVKTQKYKCLERAKKMANEQIVNLKNREK